MQQATGTAITTINGKAIHMEAQLPHLSHAILHGLQSGTMTSSELSSTRTMQNLHLPRRMKLTGGATLQVNRLITHSRVPLPIL